MNQYILKADDVLNNDRIQYGIADRVAMAQMYALMAIADELNQMNERVEKQAEQKERKQ